MIRWKGKVLGRSSGASSSALGVVTHCHLHYLLAGLFVFLAKPSLAQQSGPELAKLFAKTEAMIAMRDGVKLHTVIYAPKSSKEPLPFILSRTPYGNDGNPAASDYLKDLAAEGYIFVRQNIRGRNKSEGSFVMTRPPRDHKDPKAIDESTDTYDTIDWIVKNVPNNNGRVGMIGLSYDAWLQVMAMLDPHPALRAIAAQGSPADQFLGDDFHHNGAFRLSYGLEYTAMMETSTADKKFKLDCKDTYDWYLQLGSLRRVNEAYFHGKMPTWNDFVAHPNYDVFWQKQAFAPYLKHVTVPTLNVSGWWDQEDFYGQLKVYELLEKHDTKNNNFLVVGPWWHGAWLDGPRSWWPAKSCTGSGRLSKMYFQSATGTYFREKIQAPWFAYYLKDKGKLDLPEALLFETGSNKWVRYSAWPPKQGVAERKLYFRSGKRLSFDPPPDAPGDPFDSYVSDPANPVPYCHRPIEPIFSKGSLWPIWQGEDQRFVRDRPDVLSFETEPLAEDVTIAGDLVAHLFASTSGSDSDWIVKLIDVYPDDYSKDKSLAGYELMVAGEVLRGRFRKNFEKPEPVTPGQVEKYDVGLRWRDHCFLKGHKIMVQVQSTWFPVIDRNPQKYVPNIFEAKEEDFLKATQHVYRTPKQPSHVVLPVFHDEPPGESKAVPAQAAEAMDEKLEPEKLHADFRIARQALEEGHSGIYRYTSKEELDRIFDQAEKSLTKPMSMLAFYRVLAPAVAAIKCGHTGVSLPRGFLKTYTGKKGILPLEVRVLEGKIYVWRDLSGAPASLAGMEIRSLNGVSASRIVEQMLAAASGDGDILTNRMRRISGWTFSSQLSALAGLSSPYDVALWDSKEKHALKVHLEGAEMARLQEAARAKFPQDQRPKTAGEFKFLDDGMIAVMKIHGFGGFVDAERKKTLEQFYQESFDAMNKMGTKTLVLDLRNNGGGEDKLGKLLLSYLLDKPFKYYDDLVINAREFTFQKYAKLPTVPADAVERQPSGKYRVVNHPNLGLQQPSKPTFAGKVLILINGDCFSTTAEFLSQAHYHKRATFIGEESGGGYYGNTSGVVPALTLPHTKLIVYVPLVTYYMAVSGYQAAAHGVLPDYPIRYTIEELLAGKDKELALALELARR